MLLTILIVIIIRILLLLLFVLLLIIILLILHILRALIVLSKLSILNILYIPSVSVILLIHRNLRGSVRDVFNFLIPQAFFTYIRHFLRYKHDDGETHKKKTWTSP